MLILRPEVDARPTQTRPDQVSHVYMTAHESGQLQT